MTLLEIKIKKIRLMRKNNKDLLNIYFDVANLLILLAWGFLKLVYG